MGRFVTADNVIDGEFDTQGWNRYAYVKGNPVGAKDPTGHDKIDDGINYTLRSAHEILDYNDSYHSQKTYESFQQGNLGKYLYHSSSALFSKAAKIVTPKDKTELDQIAICSTVASGYRGLLDVGKGVGKVINKAVDKFTKGKTTLNIDRRGQVHLVDTVTRKYVKQTPENMRLRSVAEKAEANAPGRLKAFADGFAPGPLDSRNMVTDKVNETIVRMGCYGAGSKASDKFLEKINEYSTSPFQKNEK